MVAAASLETRFTVPAYEVTGFPKTSFAAMLPVVAMPALTSAGSVITRPGAPGCTATVALQVIDGLAASVTVRVWFPAVTRRTETGCVPESAATQDWSPGSCAAPSLEVTCTVPR